ncbi:MAG: hypothetical protein KC550_01025 [Nanoarchaeota archaeon]|nr:hypothetical protein [Nanoarchaeota archaeon]
MKKEIIHVDILSWAQKKGQFSKEEILNKFPKHKDLIDREMRFGHLFASNDSDEIWFLSFEDSFRLIEYEELKESRISAKEARIFAIIAIILSALIPIILFMVDTISDFTYKIKFGFYLLIIFILIVSIIFSWIENISK